MPPRDIVLTAFDYFRVKTAIVINVSTLDDIDFVFPVVIDEIVKPTPNVLYGNGTYDRLTLWSNTVPRR